MKIGEIEIADEVDDPLFGRAHRVLISGVERTRISVIDWNEPGEIPAIADPGALPPGAGGIVINELARRATRPLRYAGPYPTSALWTTLLRSFRTTGTEAQFTAELIDRMVRLARDPIAIDFEPAPHRRVELASGHAELRDGLERLVLDGISYQPDGSPARLVDDRAEIWFGDVRYAHVATFEPFEQHAIPRCTSDVIGKPFPPPLVAALAELLGDAVPAPLAAAEWLRAQTLVWVDLGGRAARLGTQLEIHAALWQLVAPHGLARLALAIVEAIAPIATRELVTAAVRRRAG
jgi:hypothetical protein